MAYLDYLANRAGKRVGMWVNTWVERDESIKKFEYKTLLKLLAERGGFEPPLGY